VIGPHTVPRLAPKVRLRFDAHSGKHMLLYPERGLELTETAARIAALCSQELTVDAIIDQLVATHEGAPRARLEAEVMAFLGALQARGLLVEPAS
jgi:coenzyme PQQ biosynthesis protein PqqD